MIFLQSRTGSSNGKLVRNLPHRMYFFFYELVSPYQNFNSTGYCCNSIVRLSNYVRGLLKPFFTSFSSFTGISSRPSEFLLFIFAMMLTTSSDVAGLKKKVSLWFRIVQDSELCLKFQLWRASEILDKGIAYPLIIRNFVAIHIVI